MRAGVINVLEAHRPSSTNEKLQTEEGNRKHYNFAGFGSIKYHLGRNKSFVRCGIFFMQVQMYDLCSYK